MRESLRIAWDRFNLIALIIGDVQGRIIALAFYFIVVLPFGVFSRLTSDPMNIRSATTTTKWLDREPVPTDLDSAREQG